MMNNLNFNIVFSPVHHWNKLGLSCANQAHILRLNWSIQFVLRSCSMELVFPISMWQILNFAKKTNIFDMSTWDRIRIRIYSSTDFWSNMNIDFFLIFYKFTEYSNISSINNFKKTLFHFRINSLSFLGLYSAQNCFK